MHDGQWNWWKRFFRMFRFFVVKRRRRRWTWGRLGLGLGRRNSIGEHSENEFFSWCFNVDLFGKFQSEKYFHRENFQSRFLGAENASTQNNQRAQSSSDVPNRISTLTSIKRNRSDVRHAWNLLLFDLTALVFFFLVLQSSSSSDDSDLFYSRDLSDDETSLNVLKKNCETNRSKNKMCCFVSWFDFLSLELKTKSTNFSFFLGDQRKRSSRWRQTTSTLVQLCILWNRKENKT